MNGRYDLRRSAVALLAGLVAGIGAYSANARLQAVPSAETAVLLLGAETVVGLGLALWPGRHWIRRRAAALAAAILGLVLMVPGPIISAIVVSGCICPGETQAPLLGIGHQYWTIGGLVGFPILLGLAALIPSASRRDEMPVAPGA